MGNGGCVSLLRGLLRRDIRFRVLSAGHCARDDLCRAMRRRMHWIDLRPILNSGLYDNNNRRQCNLYINTLKAYRISFPDADPPFSGSRIPRIVPLRIEKAQFC